MKVYSTAARAARGGSGGGGVASSLRMRMQHFVRSLLDVAVDSLDLNYEQLLKSLDCLESVDELLNL